MFHFELAYPWVFLLAPLPVAVYIVLPPFKKRRSALIVPFFEAAVSVSGARKARRTWVTRRGLGAWLAMVLCWLSLLAAAASPRLVGQAGKKIRTVRSFLIVADLSFSMAQTDWVVDGRRCSRWDAVRTILKTFVQRRKSDRMGLVVFATHPYLQAPLTTDLDAIDWLLDQTEIGMAGQFTSIGEAIAYGAGMLKKDTLKQKVMLLLTDGIDEGKSVSPMDAAQLATKDTITIYTLGIGKAHGSGGYDLDEKTLERIAGITGGKYFNAMDAEQLKAVYAQLDKIEPVTYEEEHYRPIRLLYRYPLAASIGVGLLFYFFSGLANLFKRNF